MDTERLTLFNVIAGIASLCAFLVAVYQVMQQNLKDAVLFFCLFVILLLAFLLKRRSRAAFEEKRSEDVRPTPVSEEERPAFRIQQGIEHFHGVGDHQRRVNFPIPYDSPPRVDCVEVTDVQRVRIVEIDETGFEVNIVSKTKGVAQVKWEAEGLTSRGVIPPLRPPSHLQMG
jgi:hypothetical protein